MATSTTPATPGAATRRSFSRRLLAASSAASLVLCFAVVAVWCASCFVAPYVRWKTAGTEDQPPRRTVLAVGGGHAVMRTTRFPFGARLVAKVEAGTDQPVPTLDGVRDARRAFGFEYGEERAAGMVMVTAGGPLWALTGILAALPAARWGRRYRRDRGGLRTAVGR